MHPNLTDTKFFDFGPKKNKNRHPISEKYEKITFFGYKLFA